MQNQTPKVKWLVKNWPHIALHNNCPGGYLVISVGYKSKDGAGRIFTQKQIDQAVAYVESLKQKQSKQLTLF